MHGLTEWVHDGAETLARRRRIRERVFASDAVLRDWQAGVFLNHSQRVVRALHVGRALLRVITDDLRLTDHQDILYAYSVVGEMLPLSLHLGVYVPALDIQCAEDQRADLYEPARRGLHLGAYAQTELGHGSNLRALECTARLDPSDDCWVIDTPTESATKYWPGGMGVMATHVMLMAQLILPNGRRMGPHMFIVPIRDTFSLEPLAGVSVGDMGPKQGFEGVDNGFLRLRGVRIPRKMMLMRFARVDRDGQYRTAAPVKLAYGAMVGTRVSIVRGTVDSAARAVTIAVRYSASRHQFSAPGAPDRSQQQQEDPVLWHSTQHCALARIVGVVYGLMAASKTLASRFAVLRDDLARSQYDGLADMHALSCAWKALGAERATEAVDQARRLCGGHGYVDPGLAELCRDVPASVTYEGDNAVLLQQTARRLVKVLASDPDRYLVVAVKKEGNNHYHEKKMYVKPQLAPPEGVLSEAAMVLRHRAWTKVARAAQLLEKTVSNGDGGGLAAAWATHQWTLVAAARAWAVAEAVAAAAAVPAGPARSCVAVWAAWEVLAGCGESERPPWEQWMVACAAAVAPRLVDVVNAFDYDDRTLRTVIGRSPSHSRAGYVASLAEMAAREPLNDPTSDAAKEARKVIRATLADARARL